MKILTIIMLVTIILACIGLILSFNLVNKYNKRQILNQYNFDINESVAIYEFEKELSIYIIIAMFFIFICSIIWYVTNYILINNEKIKLENIIKNIENISKRDYNFLVQETDISSFGAFKDEIYKAIINLQEYAKQIEDDKKKLSIYLSDISHQLRTPLLSVTILADNLLENISQFPEEERKLIYRMSIELDKMKWLVDSLLKIAQLDTKSVTLKKEKINIKNLLDAVQKNVEILLDLKNETIKVIYKTPNNICFTGDFKWILEAFTNIVKNAIEYSKQGDIIKIYCSQNVLYTEIIIEDNGSGINQDDLAHIFDRFYKGKNSNKDSFGIGLAISKQIITEQDGEINVESTIGNGTKFIIRFTN